MQKMGEVGWEHEEQLKVKIFNTNKRIKAWNLYLKSFCQVTDAQLLHRLNYGPRMSINKIMKVTPPAATICEPSRVGSILPFIPI